MKKQRLYTKRESETKKRKVAEDLEMGDDLRSKHCECGYHG